MPDRPKKQPTSFDVARLAGVSRSAVSRTFTEGASVSEHMRGRVLEAAERLGYQVNAMARSLQTRRSELVGIVASRLDTPFRARQVQQAARELLRRGFRPVLLAAEDDDDVRRMISSLFSYRVSGVIITSDTPPDSIIEECSRLAIPVVLINRDPAITGADRVQMDPGEGGRIAFEMLAQSNVKKMGLMAPEDRTFSVSGRADAFIENCRANGFDPVIVTSRGQSYASGIGAAEKIVSHLERIDGLFCATDLLALGAMDGMRHEYGIMIPETLQIVGFDDIEQAGWRSYDLSTVRQDVGEQAEIAVRLIFERITSPDLPQRVVYHALQGVHRGTTRPIGKVKNE